LSLTFAVEPVASVWDEMSADWIANWGEEYISRGEIPNLSKERYAEYERVGYYLQYVARDGENLAGYIGMYITNSMHTQELIASEDIVYMKPQYRGGMGTVRFVKFYEEDLRKRGVKNVSVTVKKDSSAYRLAHKMGYELNNIQLTKRLT